MNARFSIFPNIVEVTLFQESFLDFGRSEGSTPCRPGCVSWVTARPIADKQIEIFVRETRLLPLVARAL